MPAETNQHQDAPDLGAVLELLTQVLDVDVDPVEARDLTLADLGIDDDLAALRLWDAVIEEFGERTVGEPDDIGGEPLRTLGELADWCLDALGLEVGAATGASRPDVDDRTRAPEVR